MRIFPTLTRFTAILSSCILSEPAGAGSAPTYANSICRAPFDGRDGVWHIFEPRVKEVFETHGLHYLGRQTSGYFGLYIWKVTAPKLYTVELPEGTLSYRVNLLSDFLAKGWLDNVSLGRIGAGGWADADRVLNCVAENYDLTSEAFTISLLKHEAQYAVDLSRDANLALIQLEYRAKLVELIYSVARNLLLTFAEEADTSDAANAHDIAAAKIITLFRTKLGNPLCHGTQSPSHRYSKLRKIFCESSIL